MVTTTDAAVAGAGHRIEPEGVKLAGRSPKGYWRMSANSIVQRALTSRWLQEQGVPNLKQQWIAIHDSEPARVN